jgi:rare lipoprotein A (peptidoglycan hydrolase)
MAGGGTVLEDLKNKLAELDVQKRDLTEKRQKRERVAETLDIGALSVKIYELEARLSDTNSYIRAARSGSEAVQSLSEPPDLTIPLPGQLLDRVPSMPSLSDFERTGIAFSGYTTSYGTEFDGQPTASGVVFNMHDFTCAHRTLPFGTWLLVTFRGKMVVVQINDRGPFVPGRVLDLSQGAAESIGMEGVQWTEFEILLPRGG